MWRITFVILALACSCYADKDMKEDVKNPFDTFFGLTNFGNMIPHLPSMPKFLKIEKPIPPTLPNPEDIRNITFGGPGSNSTGSYHSEMKSVKYVNGVKVEDEAKSDDIKNINGNLTESHSENN